MLQAWHELEGRGLATGVWKRTPATPVRFCHYGKTSDTLHSHQQPAMRSPSTATFHIRRGSVTLALHAADGSSTSIGVSASPAAEGAATMRRRPTRSERAPATGATNRGVAARCRGRRPRRAQRPVVLAGWPDLSSRPVARWTRQRRPGQWAHRFGRPLAHHRGWPAALPPLHLLAVRHRGALLDQAQLVLSGL